MLQFNWEQNSWQVQGAVFGNWQDISVAMARGYFDAGYQVHVPTLNIL